MEFNTLFNNLKWDWRSGDNDATILGKPLKIYRREHAKCFNFPWVATFSKNAKSDMKSRDHNALRVIPNEPEHLIPLTHRQMVISAYQVWTQHRWGLGWDYTTSPSNGMRQRKKETVKVSGQLTMFKIWWRRLHGLHIYGFDSILLELNFISLEKCRIT